MADGLKASGRDALRVALRRLHLYPNGRVNQIVRRVSPSAFMRLAGERDVWSIGLLEGPSPFDLAAPQDRSEPIVRVSDVTDAPALMVADPFAVRWDGRWNLFFEIVNADTAKGEIALATSDDLRSWDYQGIVLTEPFHLSYPCVFSWDDALYMVPETWEAGAVRLYRAADSLQRWEFVTELVRGPVHLDSTIVRHHDRWWLFTETNPEHHYDTLRLFTAATLDGRWEEHPASPIVAGDARIARPGGRVVQHGDALVRYTQDCAEAYGEKVRSFEIYELSATRYAERQVDLWIRPAPWGANAMHHVDPHQLDDTRWLAFVDGH